MALRLGGLDLRRGQPGHSRNMLPLLPPKPAGLAAMVYRNQLQTMAAEPKGDCLGGGIGERQPPKRMEAHPGLQLLDKGEKVNNNIDAREAEGREHKTKRLRVTPQPSKEPEWRRPSSRESRRDSLELKDELTLPFEVEDDYFYNRVEGIPTEKAWDGSQPLGQVRDEEIEEFQGHLGGQRMINSDNNGSHLDWLPTPVKKLMKPYLDWSMGIKQKESSPQQTSEKKIVSGTKANTKKPPWQKWLNRVKGSLKHKRRLRSAVAKQGKKATGVQEKVNNFEKSYFADSTWKARSSRRSTIRGLLGKRENDTLQSEDFVTIAAALKEAGYKAVKPYLIEAKMMHLDDKGEWNHAMDRKFKLCMKAAGRDAGPNKKAEEVPEEQWAIEHPDAAGEDKKVKLNMVEPRLGRAAFAVATHWMLREIELSNLLASNVEFENLSRTVALHLTKSKMDTDAKGIKRVLQCRCEGECTLKCPYEAAWRLVHGKGNPTKVQNVDDDFLIYTKGGKKASKSQLVKAWKMLYGESVTGHSARRSGALQYIRHGWAISQVAFLGRWKSQVIYDYAQEALESMPVNASQTFGPMAQQSCTTAPVDNMKEIAQDQAIRKMGKEVESLEKKTDLLKVELEAVKLDGDGMKAQLADEVEKLEAKSIKNKGLLPKLVVCTRTKVAHWNLPSAICSPPYTWKTTCGWKFGGGSFTFEEGTMGDVDCQKCRGCAKQESGVGNQS